MEQVAITLWKDLGMAAALGLSAVGSALGVGAAGPAAIGAWKKCYAQNKAAPFILAIFIGAPLSQTIYGMIVMNAIVNSMAKGVYLLGAGIFGGLAIGMSAWMQGVIGAAASDSMAETGKGTGNYLIVLGIAETVALFVMVFIMMGMGRIAVSGG